MKKSDALALIEPIETLILRVRGQRVILDADLARLYGVTTRRLNEQVKRNPGRFPPHFMFRLSGEEVGDLKSQFATSRSGWGGKRKLPLCFTEHGALMVATILNCYTSLPRISISINRPHLRLGA